MIPAMRPVNKLINDAYLRLPYLENVLVREKAKMVYTFKYSARDEDSIYSKSGHSQQTAHG
jgi:hypothetical protein